MNRRTNGDRRGTTGADAMTSGQCLDDSVCAAILEGGVSEAVLARAKAHASACDGCRAILASLGKVRAAERKADRTLAGGHEPTMEMPQPARVSLVGERLGRFVVIEPIGRGGMGAVYAAHDETLQRNVAIKLLRSAVASGDDGRRRLLREARAMATVTHPNVVTVHEAGVHDGEVFVVMDLVDGTDLRVWCSEEQRTAAELIAVWVDAGRGLSAIHARGLVHRDFKPANVLIGRDGQVRVTDFGLVGMATHAISEPELESLRDALGREETATGTVLGTPRYMAPEQLEGRKVDAAADQFAFCVSLWAALIGEHPFGEGGLVDARGRIRRGTIVRPPPSGTAPPGVLEVLRRGLALDPSARWPSMDRLLEAILGVESRGRRRTRAAQVGLGVAAALTVGVIIGEIGERPPCTVPGQSQLAGAWDDEARARLGEAIRGRPLMSPEWPRIEAHLDEYSTRWSAERHEACVATRVRQEVSEDLLDRRMVCLDRRRTAVQTFVGLVADADFPGNASALELALALPDVASCADLPRLAAGSALPTDAGTRRELAALDAELDRIEMLRSAGQVEVANEALAAASARSDALGLPRLRARALQIAALSQESESAEAGVATWRRAYLAAIEAGPEPSFLLALDGVGILARTNQLDEASFVLDQARAYAAELGGEPLPGQVSIYAAYLAVMRQDHEAAETATLEAIAQMKAAGREDALGDAYGNLGGILSVAGRNEEAAHYTELQLSIYRETYGAGHAKTLAAEMNHASSVYAEGRFAEAEAAATAVYEGQRALGLVMDQAQSLNLAGKAQAMQGRQADAAATHREVLRLRRTVLPPRHPLLAWTMLELAQAEYGYEQFESAEATISEAIEIVGDAPDSLAYEQVILHATLSAIMRRTGRLDEALAEGRTAVEAARPLEGPVAHQASEGYEAYGAALLALERYTEADDVFAKAVSFADASEGVARLKARLRLQRAEALRGLGDDATARALAQAARRLLDAAGDVDGAEWREATKWSVGE